MTMTRFLAAAAAGALAACHDSNGPPVDPADLARLLQRVDRIEVVDEQGNQPAIRIVVTDPADIAAFGEAAVPLASDRWFTCIDWGSTSVDLFHGGEEIGFIVNQDSVTIKCSLWSSHAVLKDSEKWVRWFESHGLSKPRKELEYGRQESARAHALYERWRAATPEALRQAWGQYDSVDLISDFGPLREALAKSQMRPEDKVLALLGWFGSGAGPWSGFPAYEDAAERLLLDVPTPLLVAVAQRDDLTDAQVEGAARLFGGWTFQQERPDETAPLPADLKRKLLAHALKSDDQDKRDRAESAFGRE
jgi:hypothetical protein